MHYNWRSCCDVVWLIKGTKPGYKTYLAVLAPHAVKICVKPWQVLGAGVLARGPPVLQPPLGSSSLGWQASGFSCANDGAKE